jgi:uncharacterized phage infection (PIP) family protein YhgE
MPDSELAEAKAEIERLIAELRDSQARISEIVRQNVVSSNQRENKLSEANREIKRLAEQAIKLRDLAQSDGDLIMRLADALEKLQPAASMIRESIPTFNLIKEAREAGSK